MTDGKPVNWVILRASRLEALLPELAAQLAASRPAAILEAQTVITAHAGMQQWLAEALARHAGPGSIVANLDITLPSAWLESISRQFLGDAAIALPAWRRTHLRWVIHEVLLAPQANGLTDTRITAYLDPRVADAGLRRFQLADRLARVLTQYLAYRPDWLRAWEAGKHRFGTAHIDAPALVGLEGELLAPLWQILVARLGAHRASVLERLRTHLRDVDALDLPTLHVFGLTHLAPLEAAVLEAWARHAPVFTYLPDPCREYWGGLQAKDDLQALRLWRTQESARIDAAGGGDWIDAAQTHPLLARWGRLGQHFFADLAGWEVLADIRDHQDERPATPVSRLACMQESIRQLQPGLLATAASAPRDDASLRIHACHTALRELEVLHDALLAALDDGIQPQQMLVMAPDMGRFAPLLPAVFGASGDPTQRHLPWMLVGTPIQHSHRLFTCLAQVLQVAQGRVSASDVADLLAVPEVARALGTDASALDALLRWLRASGAAWGLDAEHRRDFGLPATPLHTLAWGVDRMLAGYVCGESVDAARENVLTLPDGCTLLPVAGVQGPDSAALGALDRLLCELRAWHAMSSLTKPASQWADDLQRRVEVLLRIDRGDADARSAWSSLQAMLARIGSEPLAGGIDPELEFEVVRELLLDALAEVPAHARRPGGVTFCNMVARRGLPFAMVCVLGLDDGQLPRTSSDGGIDLMAHLHRVGDRDVRSDDRWMFLETVMAARERLHLSWVGCGVRDGKPRNPAAPLAELLDSLANTRAVDGSPRASRPWLVEHPLQPFDARYFDGKDPALFSFAQAWVGSRERGSAESPPFLHGRSLPPDPLPAALELAALLRFWKKPAQDLLLQRMQLDLSALEDRSLQDSEPLEASLPRLHTIARRLFFEQALPLGFSAAGAPRWHAAMIPAWVEHGGLLAPGELGQRAWHAEANAVLALLALAHAQRIPATQTRTILLDVQLPSAQGNAPVRLHGAIEHAFALDGPPGWNLLHAFPSAHEDIAKALKNAADLTLGERMAIFVPWAALRLQCADLDPLPAVRVTVLAAGGTDLPLQTELRAWDEHLLAHPDARAAMLSALRGKLARIIALHQQATSQPPAYFPRTSHAVLAATETATAATKAFESSDFHTGERDYDAATALLSRGRGFDARQHADAARYTQELLAYAQAADALMHLPIPGRTSTHAHD